MSSRRETRKPDPCMQETCGSRRFYLGDDGFTYCDQGHQQSERGTVIAEDTGELQTQGRKSRKQSDDEREAVRRTLSGARAFEHYLLCYQLILWKQLHYLVIAQVLPAELEVVVRDLWALRVQNLQQRVSYESDTETEGHSQLFSSQSEVETGPETEASQARRKPRSRKDGSPVLIEALSLIYIGALLLRSPLTVADLHNRVANGELLYYRAITSLPASMKSRLPGEYQVLLDPQELLRPETIHNTVLSQVTSFSLDFGMTLPPLNTPLVLCKWVTELSLPIEVYAATKRLASILEVAFDFQVAANAGSLVVLRHPEAQLIACLVTSTKLLFPLNNAERHPAASADLSALSMDWSLWAKTWPDENNNEMATRPLSYSHALQVSESDVSDFVNDKLDQYMDWYDQHMASEDVKEHGRAGRDAEFRKAMFRSFPVPRKERDSVAEAAQRTPDQHAATIRRLKSMQGNLTPIRVVPLTPEEAGPVNRSGSFYKRYRKSGELTVMARSFYEAAAAVAGLTLDSLVQSVFAIEMKLQKWEDKIRKGA